MTTTTCPETLPLNEVFTVEASARPEGMNPRQIRATGWIPATYYGKGIPSRSLQVKGHEFAQAYKRGVRLFQLNGLDMTAKVQQIQFHPVLFDILNIEFTVTPA